MATRSRAPLVGMLLARPWEGETTLRFAVDARKKGKARGEALTIPLRAQGGKEETAADGHA